jgi:hypothetical protein
MGGRQFMGPAFRFSSHISHAEASTLLLPVLKDLQSILFALFVFSFVAALHVYCASKVQSGSREWLPSFRQPP